MSAEADTAAPSAAGAAMEGGGFYNRHSAMQAAGISLLLPHWERAGRAADLAGSPLVIVDYGSSQGRNSLAPMCLAIEVLRARVGTQVPVEVIHTDLPTNDFAALFSLLEGDPGSYLAGAANVFPMAVGRSYFQPVVRPGCVHLGWNSWTLQWLDGPPLDAPDHVFAVLSRSERVLTELRPRQAADWRRFLSARATELRPGARLLAALTGETATEVGWEWLGGELWQTVLDLGRDRILSDDEQLRLTLPTASRSLEQVMEPFAPSGTFAGLSVEHAEILRVPDPTWAAFQKDGDAGQLGQSHANGVRAWAGPTILRVLADRADRAEVVEELFSRFAYRLAAAPQTHQPFLAVAILAKH